MQLSSLLDSKLICFDEISKTKEQILSSMVSMTCTYYKQSDIKEKVLKMVLDRENESSTVYPSGIAIPHIRMEGYNDTVICLCIPRNTIIENDIHIKLFVFIITDNQSTKLYLNIVSTIMGMFKDQVFMEKLYKEKDGNGVYHQLLKADIRVKQEAVIHDIMTTDPIVVRETATIREMGELLGKHNITFLPVVNDRGVFVGEVNILQLLKVGVPDYLMMMNNLDFLRSFDTFEQLYSKEESVLVKDIMTAPEVFTYPTSSIIKVVFEMIQHQKRSITVIHRKKVVGIVTAMDIFRKAVRA